MKPGSATLYSTEILALAVELGRYPWLSDPVSVGEARSRSCGSIAAICINTDRSGCISEIGLRVSACAIGQAAAGLFARSAIGVSLQSAGTAHDAIAMWLDGQGAQPQWPGINALAKARDYPARHSAILLPWKAVQAALCNMASAR